jgi:signal transduction histidine kinase
VVHPILSSRRRLLLYLAVCLVFGTLLAGFVSYAGGATLEWSLAFAVPLAVVLGFQSLAVWYLARRLPIDDTSPSRLAASWLAAAAVNVSAWTVLGLGWMSMLIGETTERTAAAARIWPLLVLTGTLGFFVAVLGHYLLDAFERSRAAERLALELEVHAREAELRSLKAQLDPHFLFNSLNSVAALIGTDAVAARRMCFLMAGFFRKSLALGRREAIPLAEELYLAEAFLAIEEVRFGTRLRSSFEVDEDALTLAVPPLVLQPLVENAVHHGVAHLIEGGVVRVRAGRRGDRLELEVENPCDPERPQSRGTGLGLANVRQRLEALYQHRAALEVEGTDDRYRVRVLLPVAAA